MTTILIVDDDDVDRMLARESLAGMNAHILEAEGVEAALAVLAANAPDLVITDLFMAARSGLELVQEMADRWPEVPVILVTGLGTEEVAAQALQAGAASYVPKRYVVRDLLPTVNKVLAAAVQTRVIDTLPACTLSLCNHYVLRNDPALVGPLVSELQAYLIPMGICDRGACTQVGIALTEALHNAVYHGNLELPGLGALSPREYAEAIRTRARQAPYCERKVEVVAEFDRTRARYVIRDEGKGFDPSRLPDPTSPENLEHSGGRGILLIRAFMDEVAHNPAGNEITLVKRRPADVRPSS